MLHYGFQSNFCNPNSGHEKGSVENKVGYHRRNFFVPVPEFKDLKEYNKELLLRCDKDLERKHYKSRGIIKDLFEDDKLEFFKLPKIPFDVFLHEFAKADNYGKVKFDGKIYSSSPYMAKHQAIIKAGAYDVEILDDNCNLIIKHNRLYGEEKESMQWLPYLELISKRPVALKYTGLFNQLPLVLREYLEKSNLEIKKQTLQLIAKMTSKSDFETATTIFEECIKQGAKDPDSIWAAYSCLTTETLPDVEIPISNTVPELKKYIPNIQVYDSLIPVGGLKL